MKKRPKIRDYMGPPGRKTPLGTKIPPLSKKERQIGINLEKKARKLLEQHRLNRCELLGQGKNRNETR